MDTLLISVTALSLLMAAGMAVVVLKLLRDERRRSDARVVALSEMALEPAGSDFRLKPEATRVRQPEAIRAREPEATRVRQPEAIRPRNPEATRVRQPEPVTGTTRGFRLQAEDPTADIDLPLKVEASDFRLKPEATRLRPEATRPTPGATREQPEAIRPDVRSLFDEPERSSPWGGRLAVIAAIVLVVGGGGWLLLHAPSRARGEQAQTAVAERAPLELLSLRHAQEGDRLTITGLVQNPRTGAPLTRVVATAFAFGPDGTFLASGRAPIDFTSLGAGDESPFVVTVPVTGAVARYRVGFRAEDGTVIAHVDRRQESLAQR
ncbi:MAG TPA: hypothetical protein VF147_16940 [Vicinamibacterales bacterium]